ncbi:MAG: hypothetical protein HZA54_12305, partial [Planctomycetes bacterium]|nr:hypothetical protein [Planctomycetota bacterium]
LLFGQLKRRFSESGGHDRAAGYYFLHFPWGFWPWILFLPSLAVFLARGWLDRSVPRFAERIAGDHTAEEAMGRVQERRTSWLFLAAWFGTSFLFFTLLPSKRELYLLPAYPAAALAVGAFLSWAFDRPDPGPALASAPFYALCWVHGFLGVALASAAILAPRLATGLSYVRPYAEFVPVLRWPLFGVALVLAVCMLVAALLWRTGRRAGAVTAVALGVAAATAGSAFLLLPLLNPWKSARDVCDEIRRVHPAPGKVAWLGSLDESFLFYLDRPIEEIPLRAKDPESGASIPGIPPASVARLRDLLDAAPMVFLLIEPKHVGVVKEAAEGRPLHRIWVTRDAGRAADRARSGAADPSDRKVQVWSNRAP